MDLKKEYALDPAAVADGVKFDFSEEGWSITLRPTHQSNKEYAEAFARHGKKYVVGGRRQKVSGEVRQAVLAKAFADAIVVDWSGVKDDGKTIKCTPENVVDMLLKYPDFFDRVADLAGDVASYRQEYIEEVVKP